MELFHYHLLGNYDELYKPNSEFYIDKDKYKNKLWNRIYRYNTCVDVNIFPETMKLFNHILELNGLPIFDDNINPGELLCFIINSDINPVEKIRIIKKCSEMLLSHGINIREMALEEYRKQYAKDKPSRLHSLFACSEEGLGFWNYLINDGPKQLYRIEVYDEPFVSNELLLPNENLNYGEKIMASAAYFHPSKSELKPESNEYLVTGKVKIKERVL